MRYIKFLCKPIKKIKLKEWEKLVINSMAIRPFFTLQENNSQYYLAYIDDDSPLDIFNAEYLDAMKIEELTIKSVVNLIIKQSPSFSCIIDKDGFINLISKNINKYYNKNKKPYQSWLWNSALKRWQAPFPHPYEYEGEFIWDENLKKWIKNVNYLSYIWNEQEKRWIFTPNNTNVVI